MTPPSKRRRLSPDIDPPRDSATKQHSKQRPEAHSLPSSKPSVLTARTSHVARSQVDAKWRVLDQGPQEQIRDLLSSTEIRCVGRMHDSSFSKSRSRGRRLSGQQDDQAERAVRDVSKRIVNKLDAIPFPPSRVTRHGNQYTGGKYLQQPEREWSLDGLIDLKRAVQAQLVPAQHSVILLDQEITREEALLEQDKELLRGLEKNAERQQRARNEAYKKVHPALKEFRQRKSTIPRSEVEVTSTPSRLEVEKDPELAKVMGQLSNHLTSLENNVGALTGLGDLVDITKAHVDDVLYQRLSPEQYAVLTEDEIPG